MSVMFWVLAKRKGEITIDKFDCGSYVDMTDKNIDCRSCMDMTDKNIISMVSSTASSTQQEIEDEENELVAPAISHTVGEEALGTCLL